MSYVGKSHGAYTKPQQRKKEESAELRGERNQIRFFDIRFEGWQVVGLRQGNVFYKFPVLGMDADLWKRVREVGSETGKLVNPLLVCDLR